MYTRLYLLEMDELRNRFFIFYLRNFYSFWNKRLGKSLLVRLNHVFTLNYLTMSGSLLNSINVTEFNGIFSLVILVF